MQSKYRKTHCIIIILCLFSVLNADTDWRKYGWQIYQNAGDARSIALGNTMAADYQSVSVLWNPSIDGSQQNRNLIYGHQSRFAGIIQSDLIAYSFKTKKNRKFNFLLLHESVGSIPNTEGLLLDWGLDGVPNSGDLGENNGYLDEGERLNNDDISYFNQRQIGVHLSTQFSYLKYNFGISVRSLFHTLDDHLGTGIGFDIGVDKTYFENTKLGLAIQNVIPGMMVWDSGLYEISKPQIITGISQKLFIQKYNLRAFFLSDVIIDVSNQSLSDAFNIGSSGGTWRFGMEFTFSDRLNIRIGRNRLGFYTTGLGISWNNFEVNYAYQLNLDSVDLGDSHVLSFSMNPGWLIKKFKK